MAKSKKQSDLEQKLVDAIADLQRTRADFENYQKRVEFEKKSARESGQASAILKLLPVIDNIERAVGHIPAELEGNAWADGIASLAKSFEKTLSDLDIKRIDSTPGVPFNPDLHEAIQFDEESEGEQEVIAEELQPGYMLGEIPIRHAMVKVTKK